MSYNLTQFRHAFGHKNLCQNIFSMIRPLMFMRIGGGQHNNEFFWHVHSKATEKGSVRYNPKKMVNEGKGQGRLIGLTKQCLY